VADSGGLNGSTPRDAGAGVLGGPTVRDAVLVAAVLIAQQVAGKATREALFLSNFDVKLLPLASGATALFSLAAVFGFARGMAALSPSRLMPRALAIGSALLVGEWGLSFWSPRAAALAVYLHMGLFGATLVSGFWSLVNERFDPHTTKRAMAPIGMGASLGGIGGGLATWLLATVISVPMMLPAMAGMYLICLRFTLRLRPAAGGRPGPPAVDDEAAPRPSGLRLIRSVAYLRRLALLISLGAFMEGILDYVFNSAAAANFEKGRALISFFALFHASVGVLSLAVQAALVRPALERLGVGGTIAVQPAAVAIGGALAIAFPRLWSLVLLRATHGALRNSLFRSGYEQLYAPLPREQKRPTKAIVDVGFDRLGTITGSAAVTLVLILAPASPTRPLLALAAFTAGLILLLAPSLRRGYVAALAHSLRTRSLRTDEIEVVDATMRRAMADSDRERASAADAPAEAPATIPDPLLEAIADLRSGDPGRIRLVLRREEGLDPALVAHMIPLLARDDVFGDALWALRRAAPRSVGQLLDALLDPLQPPVVRRRLPRVLKATPTQQVVDGLMLGLRDERLDLRFRCAQALARLREHDATLVIARPQVFAAAIQEIDRDGGSERSLDYVFTILALALDREPLEIALRALRVGDQGLRGTALEYLENVLPEPIRQRLWPRLEGPARPAPSGRSAEEIRDDLLRSTAMAGLRRSSILRGLRATRSRGVRP
jgi:ATP/ADP translocase